MQRIAPYEIGGGSKEADTALEGIAKMFEGAVPNFHRVMAVSPAAITAFEHMRRSLQSTKLRAAERELIALEVSRRNRCDYCLAAHTTFSRRFKVSEADIAAIRKGTPPRDQRLALVQRAAQRLIDTRGRLSDEELQGFRDAGLSDGELIEVIAIIGWYVWSTFVNNLAGTEIDGFFAAGADVAD